MEDFFVLQSIIRQGLENGYMGNLLSDPSIMSIENKDGNWILSDGTSLGSTWDIILNPEFAKVMWKDEHASVLTSLVLMSDYDRTSFLRDYVSRDEVVEPSVSVVEQEEKPQDALMSFIMEGCGFLRDVSPGVFKESCETCYNWVKPIVSKTSVTELNETDIIMLNGANKASEGAVSKYLSHNGRQSFSKCPDCGQPDFNHTHGCSIESKVVDWLTKGNQGC